jgi:hypothetical protein
MTKVEIWRPFDPFKLQMAFVQNHVKTYQHVCVNSQIPQLLREEIDQWGVNCNSSFPWLNLHWRQQILELRKITEISLFELGQQWQHQLNCECHLWHNVNLSTKGVECGWKKYMQLFLSHVETNISHNGSKGVVNYIMGSSAFVAMSTT